MFSRLRFSLLAIVCLGLWAIPAVRDRALVNINQQRAYIEPYEGVATSSVSALIRYSTEVGSAARQATTILVNGKPIQVAATGPVPASDNWKLKTGSATLTSEQAEAILAEYDSPAKGYGYAFVTGYTKTGIDNGYIMAMFIKESTAGKYGVAKNTLSSGNIICTRDPCYGRFNAYKDWAAGIEAHFELLNDYAEGRSPSGKKHETIDSAIEEWAPRIENDTDGYIRQVHEMVGGWRKVANPRPVEEQPAGPAIALSEAPGGFVEPWDGFFAAECAGLHSGARDHCAPEGTVVRAPVNGKFLGIGFYDDAMRYGHYFMFQDDDGREWYFGHLKEVNPLGLQPGEKVQAGMEMGKLGPFSYSTPHTHNQLRVKGVLTDPGPVYDQIRAGFQASLKAPLPIELPVSLPGANQVFVSPPLKNSQGCVWTNALVSLQHNEGLRHVTLKPGESWSHNEAWADSTGMVLCGKLPGGGMCDLAGRYLNVAHQMGLQDGADLHWANHNTDLAGLDYADEVVIETGKFGTRNGADLVIVNNTDKTLRIEAQAVGDSITVRGWWQD